MTGRYDLVVSTNLLRYEISINRNITIIKGDSATGKTSLIRLISDIVSGRNNNVKCNMREKVFILPDASWDIVLGTLSGKIIFIDEGSAFVRSEKFASCVKGSDNYFVIITRRSDLCNLAFSVNSIYELGSIKHGNVTVNRLYQRFSEVEKG